MATLYPNRASGVVLTVSEATTGQAVDIQSRGASNIQVAVTITDIHSVTPSVTPSIQYYTGEADDATYTILTGTAMTTVSTQVLRVGVNLTASANAIAQDIVAPVFKLNLAHGDTDAVSYLVTVYGC